MKPLFLLLAAATLAACSDTATGPAPAPGHLVVYVYYDGSGLPDRTLEIVETGDKAITDESGLAEFDLAPGRYVLRAYDITTPGPGLPYVDREIQVKSGQDQRIEIFDCLPCV
jgi:hypothetical protein